MPVFLNPFAKHDVSEFEGVYKPFEEAQRHPSVVAANEERFSVKDDVEKHSKSSSDTPYTANTLEALKAEIDADIAASGHDSIYDRMFDYGFFRI